MTKFHAALYAALSLALAGCEAIDPLVGGSGVATVVSVNRHNGRCVLTFQKKGDNRLYVSVPATPYKSMRCSSIEPGHTVPIPSSATIRTCSLRVRAGSALNRFWRIIV